MHSWLYLRSRGLAHEPVDLGGQPSWGHFHILPANLTNLPLLTGKAQENLIKWPWGFSGIQIPVALVWKRGQEGRLQQCPDPESSLAWCAAARDPDMLQEALTSLMPGLSWENARATSNEVAVALAVVPGRSQPDLRPENSAWTVTELLGLEGGQLQLPCACCAIQWPFLRASGLCF